MAFRCRQSGNKRRMFSTPVGLLVKLLCGQVVICSRASLFAALLSGGRRPPLRHARCQVRRRRQVGCDSPSTAIRGFLIDLNLLYPSFQKKDIFRQHGRLAGGVAGLDAATAQRDNHSRGVQHAWRAGCRTDSERLCARAAPRRTVMRRVPVHH